MIKLLLFAILTLLIYSHAVMAQMTLKCEHDGINRDFLVYVPNAYDGSEEVPLVFNFHGTFLDGNFMMNYTLMNNVADTAGFIVVYPNAIGSEKNFNSYDWPRDNPQELDVNDLGYVDAMLDTLIANYSIDSDRIYACGFSAGGYLSLRLACQVPNRIAAIATVGPALSLVNANACQGERVVPWLGFHGTKDVYLEYDADGPGGWQSVNETLNQWVALNGCVKSDTTMLPDIDPNDGTTVQKISFYDNEDRALVVMHKIIDGGHTWPGGVAEKTNGWGLGNTTQDVNASEEIWKFVSQFTLSQFTGGTNVNTESFTAATFALAQNYPNPFNPSTTIEFSLPKNERVKLAVYDLLGREVASLVDGRLDAGQHSFVFDGSNLTSGIYFYRLQAGAQVQTRKLMLVK